MVPEAILIQFVMENLTLQGGDLNPGLNLNETWELGLSK